MSVNDYGLKWGKQNADTDSAGLEDLILYSSKPILKYKAVGNGSIQIEDGGGVVDQLVYTHNLGYEPQYEFLTQWFDLEGPGSGLQTSYVCAPYEDNTLWDLGMVFSIIPYMTTTEFRVKGFLFQDGSGIYDFDFFYKVYYDPDANL